MFRETCGEYAVVVAGGEIQENSQHLKRLLDLVRGASLLVAADSGAAFLSQHKIVPSVLVGDFDSCDDSIVNEMECRGTEIVRLNRRKDKTDTEVALDIIVDRGYGWCFVIGALGGARKEHSLANVMLIETYVRKGLDVVLDSGSTVICSIVGKGRRRFRGKMGDWVSLFPITREVTGVSTCGLEFPLREATLLRGSTYGVSNVMTKEEALVCIDQGFLLIIITDGDVS
ncbi:MAG: thiamine diphosphokinase [Bacillota bacterium]